MKECEIFSNLKVPCGSMIVARVDGRNFSKLSHDLQLKKPYDRRFVENMVEISCIFFREFNPSFIYTFSDEINILFSEIPFGGRVEKMDSVFASFLGSAFTMIISKNQSSKAANMNNLLTLPSFDCRIIPLSCDGVAEYFKIRQKESWRNCINGYAYWTLRKEHGKDETVKILNRKKSSKIHDLLFDRGINLAETPAWQRRGVGIYKKEVLIEGYNPILKENVLTKRRKLFVDWDLPIFGHDFFKDNSIF